MRSLAEIANDLAALMAGGQRQDAAGKYWAQDITCIEPPNLDGGTAVMVAGNSAARAKLACWAKDYAIEDELVDGPFITGNQFALFIDMEIICRTTGKRATFCEIAVYTVREGKIAEERHFHE